MIWRTLHLSGPGTKSSSEPAAPVIAIANNSAPRRKRSNRPVISPIALVRITDYKTRRQDRMKPYVLGSRLHGVHVFAYSRPRHRSDLIDLVATAIRDAVGVERSQNHSQTRRARRAWRPRVWE